MSEPVPFRVNGKSRTVKCAPDASLLDVLRDTLGITSPKNGCAPQAQCGCCCILVDGAPKLACAVAIKRVAGKEVTTLEGIPGREREILARAFVSHGALQCGFCIPGIVMRSKAILDKNARASRDEIAKSLDVHLCRCTGYTKILQAIQTAGTVWKNGTLPQPAEECRVGRRFAKVEGGALALGERAYIDDMKLPGMLFGAVLLSEHPRAKLLEVDIAPARKIEGVVDVATWRAVPGERYQGLIYKDWPIFVREGEETRCVGDVIAVVAGETREAARQGAAAVRVQYDVLPPVTDPEDPKAKLLSKSVVRRGDVDAALAKSKHVVTAAFRTQRIEHAFLEPESCLAVPEGDTILVYSQGQGIYDDRRQIADVLRMPEEKVRVVLVSAGGAFGGKEDLSIQAQTALLAHRTGRPVKLTLTREESMRLHPKRHPIRMTYTVGC
ncbi:MAG: molybdopterin-dependent oxidoreductase, partial [Planctomycetes bacterium]|nr:molybdopterin-dependent oxidoreductase [Planctomycetota bacterium]